MVDYASFFPNMMKKWEEAFALPGFCLADNFIFQHPELMCLQRRRELQAMVYLPHAVMKPKVYMEIGADKAGTLWHWIDGHDFKKVIACEFRGTPYKHLFEKHFPNIQFLWLEESSYTPQARDKVQQFLGPDTIDCLFIDGDKGAFDKDFHLYWPLVSTPGLVFMHDIYDRSGKSPCAKAFRELASTRTTSTIIDLTESVMAKYNAKIGKPSTGCYEDWLRASGDDCGVGVFYKT